MSMQERIHSTKNASGNQKREQDDYDRQVEKELEWSKPEPQEEQEEITEANPRKVDCVYVNYDVYPAAFTLMLKHKLPPSEWKVFSILSASVPPGSNRVCYSYAELNDEFGMKPRTLNRHVGSLQRRRLIKVIPQAHCGSMFVMLFIKI